ncbi:hypothetical protein GCM10023192_88640 [Amycolatopsis samaneae]
MRIYGWPLQTAAAFVDDFDMASTVETGAGEVSTLAGLTEAAQYSRSYGQGQVGRCSWSAAARW